MKRYSMDFSTASSTRDDNGPWIAWRDYQHEIGLYRGEIRGLNDKIRRLEISNVVTDECNCLEMARGRLGDYPHMVMDPWWVCPKHGYKKR